MMVAISVTTEGLDKLQLKLDRVHGPLLEKALKRATMVAARTLVAPIRAAAPVAVEDHRGRYPHKRGQLRRSVKATAARRRDKPGAIVGPRVWYRHFPITGTSRGVTANPFVTRVANQQSTMTKHTFLITLRRELNL